LPDLGGKGIGNLGIEKEGNLIVFGDGGRKIKSGSYLHRNITAGTGAERGTCIMVLGMRIIVVGYELYTPCILIGKKLIYTGCKNQ
jgi:hypothetical protein